MASEIETASDVGELVDTPEVPEWVTTTPPDHSYTLTMFENNDISIEEIMLTREEYVELKSRLAALRGYGTRDTAN